MSEDTAENSEMRGTFADLDNCRVSTILEEMFYVFDSDARLQCSLKPINRLTRMRLALMVLRESDYARMDATKRVPIIIPSPKLRKLLGLERLTTDVEALVLPSSGHSISPDETMRHVRYLEAFTEALANGIAVYVTAHTTILNMWGLGLLRQRRGPGGKLQWSITKEARKAGSFEQALKLLDKG